MMTGNPPSAALGVHSEVGVLRKVLVCAPGRAHERLTPTNADSLLFDDVMWVQNARRDHAEFVTELRARGVDVAELHGVLAETLAVPGAKAWLLDRKIVVNEVGLGLVDETRAFLEELPDRELAEFLIGGCPRPTCPTTSAPATSRWPASRPACPSTSCRPCRTPSTPATRRAGSTAE